MNLYTFGEIMQSLEEEIKEATQRIENRETEINRELENLNEKIGTFTKVAWGFVWLGLGVAIYGIFLFVTYRRQEGFDFNLLGDFMSGTVTSVWSLAGLFFIYVAFLGQKQQLLNQQIEIMYSQLELQHTRLELKGQKEEMTEQNRTLKQQRFENTFFQQLNLFNGILNSMDIQNLSDGKVTRTGRDCFKSFYKSLAENAGMEINKSGVVTSAKEKTIDVLLNAYDKTYNKHRSDLSHYFRTLYHILKFIDFSEIDNKKQYVSIVRAQLSSYEQVLVFYNCLHDNGRVKFKPLLEKYSLLKNIDDTLLLNISHKTEYDKNVFGS